MTENTTVLQTARAARDASRKVALANTGVKNRALSLMARYLLDNKEEILTANSKDVEGAKARNTAPALLDRLTLDERRIATMARSLGEMVDLQDPVGEIIHSVRRPNGLEVGRVRVPLGVVGIIYEARPNVTADAAGLCLKSGNAVILRGSSEALHSNRALASLLSRAVREAGLPESSIQLLDDPRRESVYEMLKLEEYIDVIIPRGGEGLIRSVVEHSRIPVIKHYKGVCHTFVDRDADLEMARRIAFNAKVQRPGVCNAMETLLVDAPAAQHFLPSMISRFRRAGVEVRGCARTRALAEEVKEASENDWYAEFLDLVLAVRVVDGLEEAIEHIHRYGSQHSEAIITANYGRARRFLREVDAAAVFVNASTRFSDGGEFGMGAEIGISTQKLHARGPMGLNELTSTKFIVLGEGQIRE